jgi:hypothetical protein
VPSQPTLLSDTLNTVTISWDAVIGSQSDIYVVSWAKGASGEFNDSYQTTDTFYTITELVKRQTYRFRLQVKTPCDFGQFSQELSVSLSEMPAQMNTVRTAIEDCSVRIAWDAPGDGGSPILGYKIEVSADSEQFYDLNSVCNSEDLAESLSCLVSMTTLRAEPFNLAEGALVVVRAQAFNAYGQGSPSPVNVPSDSEARIVTAPLRISEAPVLLDESNNSMTITWAAVPQSQLAISYELHWMPNEAEEFEILNETYATEYTVEELGRSGTFRYIVRAKNACGLGEFSPVL